MRRETKHLIAGQYMRPVTFTYDDKEKYVLLQFNYNAHLVAEIKAMEGAKWLGGEGTKAWKVPLTQRNLFQFAYLEGKNPYARYDGPLLQTASSARTLYAHQLRMKAHGLTRHYCIIASEMGTGKTLAAIEILEDAGVRSHEAMYVGPRAGVVAVERELRKWQSKVSPTMLTYEGLVKLVKSWDKPYPPRALILDESSKVKTPTAQRSQAARLVADAIREKYGDDGFVILMSGTPAPKSPTDWWNQCEIACPGFIREGNIHKFTARYAIINQEINAITGGVYPQLVTWRDDENKCNICGLPASEHAFECQHNFVPSVNEVKNLYERLQGLVIVQFKKDCLDLPEKRYVLERVSPTPEILRAAQLIKSSSPRAIEALTRLRELSDGFQYTEEVSGTKPCDNCNGTGKAEIAKLVGDEVTDANYVYEQGDCPLCKGTGSVSTYKRVTVEVETPKDQILERYLEDHEEVGRLVVWAGFTGSIDHVIDVCHRKQWHTLRIDGRAFSASTPEGNPADAKLYFDAMDKSSPNLISQIPRLCVVGHPQAGGMALTFTAAPTALFYSNAFDGGARMQAEDRIHRVGMDVNRGATIVDIVHLATDKLVLDNLKNKRRLQNLTMGEIEEAFANDK